MPKFTTRRSGEKGANRSGMTANLGGDSTTKEAEDGRKEGSFRLSRHALAFEWQIGR